MVKVERTWIELQPYLEAEVKPLDELVRNVLASLYNYRFPVKYLIMYDGEDVKRLRFFINVPKHFRQNIVEAFSLKNVLAVEREPPKRVYSAYARLKLLHYYAYPILPLTYEPKENYVDLIASSMVGRGNIVCEIDFVGSLLARANVASFLNKKYFKKATGVKQVVSKGKPKGGEVFVFTPLERTLHDAIKEKAIQELFVCRIIVRGENVEDVKAVVAAFPRSGMNDVRAAYVRRKPNTVDGVVKPRLSYGLKYMIYAAAAAVSATACAILYLGNLAPLFPLSTSIIFYILAAALPISIAYAFVKKVIGHDICLNTKELSMIVSIPTRKENLPIEFAPQPPRRIELPHSGQKEPVEEVGLKEEAAGEPFKSSSSGLDDEL